MKILKFLREFCPIALRNNMKGVKKREKFIHVL